MAVFHFALVECMFYHTQPLSMTATHGVSIVDYVLLFSNPSTAFMNALSSFLNDSLLLLVSRTLCGNTSGLTKGFAGITSTYTSGLTKVSRVCDNGNTIGSRNGDSLVKVGRMDKQCDIR